MDKSRRKKKCKLCGEQFTPYRDFQPVCKEHEYQYAIEQLNKQRNKKQSEIRRSQKAVEAKARKVMQLRKESLKPRAKLLREAQQAFNSYIRARDENKPCISCGRSFEISPYAKGQLFDAGHYRSVGSSPENRFNEDNVHGQCVRCNRELSGNAVEYRKNLILRIGLERVEAVENNNQAVKYSLDDLRRIRDEYRSKVRVLRSQ